MSGTCGSFRQLLFRVLCFRYKIQTRQGTTIQDPDSRVARLGANRACSHANRVCLRTGCVCMSEQGVFARCEQGVFACPSCLNPQRASLCLLAFSLTLCVRIAELPLDGDGRGHLSSALVGDAASRNDQAHAPLTRVDWRKTTACQHDEQACLLRGQGGMGTSQTLGVDAAVAMALCRCETQDPSTRSEGESPWSPALICVTRGGRKTTSMLL